MENVTLAMLGRAKKVMIDKENTTIVNGAGKKADIEARVNQIKAQIEETTSDYDREKLQERLAKLAGGVAVIRVGGATEVEVKERKDRVDDAMHATRAAVEEGIVPGGGVALLRASEHLKGLRTKNDDQKTGVEIVRKALSAPARAQSWELSGLAGYTPSASLDHQAPELSGLDIRGGFTWGVQVSRSFTPHWSAEVSWTRQSSALRLETGAGNADLFAMTVGQLHGNAVRQFGAVDARLRPFVFAGIGATFLSGDDLESETKLSFGLGGGVKYFPWKRIGVRGQIRYKPTLLHDDEAGRFCDPFGFCQGTLQQIEFAVGAIVRF
jgi:hypothetical protein